MKIACEACGAKYTIADDKVRGRRVKIRCKGCGTPIVVDGQNGGGPSISDAETDAALGPAPLVTDETHARRVADLHLYLRQHHGPRDTARTGRELAAAVGD